MRLITGCLRPTPTAFLPVLSGIAPAPLRRELHTHRLVTKASSNPNNLLHDIVEGSCVSGSAATEVRVALFLTMQQSWEGQTSTSVRHGEQAGKRPRDPPNSISRPIQLSPQARTSQGGSGCHWTGSAPESVGFNAAMHRWGLRPSAACQCGAPEQTAQHILSECPDLRPPDNVDLTHPTPGTVTWLEHLRDVA